LARTQNIYNNITSPERIAAINKENAQLRDDFIEYLESVGRADSTIYNYGQDLNIFFCWVMDNLDNKSFIQISKRDIVKFQNHAINVWKWSPNRIRTVKAAVSSLGNYVENILDDEYEGYRSIVNKVESPPKELVMEKTVLTKELVERMLGDMVEAGEFKKACFFALAAYGGRRKAELCRFKVSDFGDDHLVCNGALYKSAPMKTKGRGKNGKQLPCYTLVKPFKPYFDLWMAERKRLGIESEWLFPKDDDPSSQMSAHTVDSWARTLSHTYNMRLHPHCYRHFHCTMLARAGIPDSVITEIYGWSSSAMCKIYNDADADEQIGAYFDESGEITKRSTTDLSEV